MIGKPCPDTEIPYIINFSKSDATINDFRGKILILDFFTTFCRGCVLSFPKYDSLQREFRNKIQILLCTSESKEAVQRLFNRFESLKKLDLATIVSDTILKNIFPHRTVPHVVVIDAKGVVRAVTDEVDENDIQDMLAGDKIDLPVKEDAISYNPGNPQIIGDYQYYNNPKHFYFYSYLAPYSMATAPPTGVERDEKGKVLRIQTKGDVQKLYGMAYRKTNVFNESRVILDFKDSLSFKNVDLDKGINCYTYDLIVNPAWPAKRAFKYMQYQLDAFFNLQSDEEKRKIKCWVLRRIHSAGDRLFSKENKPHAEIDGHLLQMVCIPWWTIMNVINGDMAVPPYQIVDKTGINPNQRVNLNINIDFANFEEVKNSLIPYGLLLTHEYLPMDVIVLKNRE
jgi:thiol-disulfide isomerase/thioredoxin